MLYFKHTTSVLFMIEAYLHMYNLYSSVYYSHLLFSSHIPLKFCFLGLWLFLLSSPLDLLLVCISH